MSTRPAIRWLRRIGIAVAVLVVVLAVALWWLLGTGSGLRFAVGRVVAASDGTISVQHAAGDLAGPLQLTGVRYRDPQSGIDAKLDKVSADIAVWSLLGGRVRFTDLEASGVHVALKTTPTQPSGPTQPFSLKPPLNLVLDNVHIGDIAIQRDGKPLFAATSLNLAGAWTTNGLMLKRLALRAPQGKVDLAGHLQQRRHVSGNGKGQFHWTRQGTTWAGEITADSDGRTATLAMTLTQPVRATLHLSLQQHGKLPWKAKLDLPSFPAKTLLGDTSLKTLALALQGYGDRDGGTLTGHVDLDTTRVQLQPLVVAYAAAQKRVNVSQLVLASPDIKGKLTAHATLALGSTPIAAKAAVQWRDVRLPASLAGRELASAGDITLAGSIDRYHLAGRMTLGPPGQLAHLRVDLDGTPQLITLKQLAITQPKGQLTARGTLTLKPQVVWNLTATGKHFNPGLLLPGWKGSLNLALATTGHITDKGPDATLNLKQLDGHLRQRTLRGHGKLHVSPSMVFNGTLALASGKSRIRVDAHGKQTNHVDLQLGIISLNDWLPDAGGALHGHVNITGLWPALAVQADLRGAHLKVGTRHVGALQLTASVPDIQHPGGALHLAANQLALGGLGFRTVTLTAKGNEAHHAVHLDATGKPLSLRVALTGAMHGRAWTGTLSTLDLDVANLAPWHLRQPAQLAWKAGRASISKTCLTSGTPVLCVTAMRQAKGMLAARYHLAQFPLAMIGTLTGSGATLHAAGVVNGDGQLTLDAKGQLSGHATLVSPTGSITYTDRPKVPLLAWHDFHVSARLAPQQKHVTLAASFAHGGTLAGNVDISGKQQVLAGHIAMHLTDLAPVELFTNALANVSGRLDADLRLGGTVASPVLQGAAALEQFAAEVPAVGLKLHDGSIQLATTNTHALRLDGHVASGNGTLQLSGVLGTQPGNSTKIHIRGDKVLAANIPAANVTVSPDLTLDYGAKGMHVAGKVRIDKARVELEKLPGVGTTQASPDVVVVDAKQSPAQSKGLPIYADVTVNLGHATHLIGYGLDGNVSGQLHVHQTPGKTATGRGQIVINGTFKAYGQDLTIQQGRLLFASTPVANPGLDIRAVRLLHPNATIGDDQEVGLDISGTAQHPVMTVFSNPPMEQADALSYLITGKPLSAVKGGQGNMVDAAAQALGSAAGDLLAKGIGSRLGIDAGVSNNAALGTTAFTVGKYLSPRLYLSYGVGLFDPGQVITLRYILSNRWNFEAVQATAFSRAGFNYRLER